MILKIFLILVIGIFFTGCFELKNEEKLFFAELKEDFKSVEVQNGVSFLGVDVGGLGIENVTQVVLDSRGKINKSPRDAYVDHETWDIVTEVEGEILDIELTVLDIFGANVGKSVRPVVKTLTPRVSYESLRQKIRIIGWYSTILKDGQVDRNFNIKRAAGKIDKVKVAAGEDFSFNDVVGNCSVENGYRLAPVIVKRDDEYVMEEGPGGGVCQVSTTLFNAISMAGLEVLERHSHSKQVGYALQGDDAAIVWGYADFRFRNTNNFPVMIRAFSAENSLCVEVWENRMQ